jgi:outer membrane biosynthesis protein TonB
MNRFARVAAVVSVLALAPVLAGCDTFDPTDIFSSDMFGTKKKLPGERKPVFPEGTPGVAQGVPQELVKGYQEPPPEPPPQATAQPEEKPKPKPKPKPKVVAKPAPADEPAPTSVTVRPSQPQPQQQQWPDPPQQRPASGGWGSPQGQAAWPDPPSTSR